MRGLTAQKGLSISEAREPEVCSPGEAIVSRVRCQTFTGPGAGPRPREQSKFRGHSIVEVLLVTLKTQF